MEPELLYLVACDEVEIDPTNFHRVNLRGVMARSWSTARPPFPVTRPEFCIFAMFTGGQGPVDIAVRIVNDVSGRSIFRTHPRRIRFAGRVDDVTGVTFRIRSCKFPAAGLYWIECVAAQQVIGRQRLWVLARGNAP